MKVAIAADHAGTLLMTPVMDEIRRLGHEVLDLGTHDPVTPDDYPDRAADLAAALTQGRAERGVLICGSGVGASVAANKVRGIRAALCHDTYSAHQGVEHDQMNVLCLGGRVIGDGLRRSPPWKQNSEASEFCGTSVSESVLLNTAKFWGSEF